MTISVNIENLRTDRGINLFKLILMYRKTQDY